MKTKRVLNKGDMKRFARELRKILEKQERMSAQGKALLHLIVTAAGEQP